MGKSPYLRTWYKMPTLTAPDSPLREILLPGSESLPPDHPGESAPLPPDNPSESAPLRNPYLSRGRQMGARKKSARSIESVVVPDLKASKAVDSSATEKPSGEPSRLYLRRWYPGQFDSAVDMINEPCSAVAKKFDRDAVPFDR